VAAVTRNQQKLAKHSGGIKPLNAPRTVHVRTDSNGNPTSIQAPPAIESPRARRTARRRKYGISQKNQHTEETYPPSFQGRELEGGSNRVPPTTTSNARKLRSNTTPAENLLWKHLRKTQIAKYKFTRQHSVGPYIVDFCCRSVRLIIELDGGHHATQQESDIARQQDLEAHGYRVIRFWNNEVFENTEGVLFKIAEELERQSLASNPHPSPLPSREMEREKRKASLVSDGKWMRVAEIENLWKVNDEWWRGPDEEISRLYYVLRLESGQQITIYLDLIANNWYRQAG